MQFSVTRGMLLRGMVQVLAALLMVLLSTLPAAANVAPGRPLDSLEHRRWLAADGGPSQVGAIAQGSDGYVWIGTNESLVRFDGVRFVRHGSAPEGSPAIVAALQIDADTLWVALRSGGVRRLRGGVLGEPEAGPGAPRGMVYGMARERGGALWAAADDGLARLSGAGWQRVGREQGFSGPRARAVLADRAGGLWVAGDQRLFYRPAHSQGFVDTGLAFDGAGQLAQAPDGALWITERYRAVVHRVVRDGTRFARGSTQMEAPALGLLFDRSGGLWLGTAGRGLLHVAQPASLEALAGAEVFGARQGLSSNFVWALHEDGEGNLWVGTNAGLDRFRQRVLMPAALPAGVRNVALAAGAGGSVWIGPGAGPALRLQAGQVERLALAAPVNSALRDAGGDVWMAGPAGIWRARGKQLVRIAGLPPGAGADTPVRAMAVDAHGDPWVSINRVGLFQLHAGKWRTVPASAARASQRMPVSALSSPDGWLWFGYRDGLLEARRGGQVRRWGDHAGLALGHITALAHHAGRTWIGGQHGLGFVQGDRFRRLQLPDNALFDNIYAIIPAPGAAGADLWLHARAGIFQLAAAELDRAIADPAHRIRYRSFDAMGGLANDPQQVLPLPTAVRGSDGRLWFSTSGGVASIDPARLPPQAAPPAVAIEAVRVDGAAVPLTESLTLGPEVQRISVDYTALSLAAPERLSFRYRLDGYDAGWVDAGRARQATYTGLKPGRYVFRVMALNRDGVPSTREASFRFDVARVFYRHPLFLLGVSALLASALWLLYKAAARRAAERVRDRLQERHRERERIARELHDTLLQGVNGLVLRFQAAADMLPADAPVRRSLEQALQRADGVLVEGRDRVRALRGGPHDTRELHEALACVGEELARESGSSFTLIVAGTVKGLQPAILDEVYRIGHEAIHNACAHAHASHVCLRFGYRFAGLSMSVTDDGRGIDPAWLGEQGRPEHWGLRGMRERAERVGATLTIDSAPGQGVRVRLAIPARLAYRRRWHWRRGR